RNGQILGRGRLDLDPSEATENLRIELTPVTSGAAVRVVSGYSEGVRPIPVKKALVAFEQNGVPQTVNEEGLRIDPERSRASTFMVRAQSNKHWPTLAMGVEGDVRDVHVYPESMMKSLLDLTLKGSSRSEAEHHGVVWGRVLKDGKPVRGVEVELAGNYTPV